MCPVALVRKGQLGDERIPITTDEILIGRGRECTVHCLSIHVSRFHLKIIPKKDGNICIFDLGSSNGTFLNKSKIDPKVEIPVSVGDEIGIGNINPDDKDCFVYVVCRIQEQDENVILDNPCKTRQPSCNTSKPVENNEKSPDNSKHCTMRNLKRSAETDEIIILDDEDDDIKVFCKSGCETVSPQTKRPRFEVTESKQEPTLIEEHHIGLVSSNTDNKTSVTGLKMCGDPVQTAPSIDDSWKPYSIETFQKPVGLRLSTLLNEDDGSFTGKRKLSSTFGKGLSISTCSTPNTSDCLKIENSRQMLTSTPCPKTVSSAPSFPEKSGAWSPIVKVEESRYSQESSSANYTMDEEIIHIDDDNDEIFPCSQMFAEDIKPHVADLEKEVNVIDLCHENDDDEQEQEDEMDRVVIIESSEDEEYLEDDLRWYTRLSQSIVKVEPEIENEVTKKNRTSVENLNAMLDLEEELKALEKGHTNLKNCRIEKSNQEGLETVGEKKEKWTKKEKEKEREKEKGQTMPREREIGKEKDKDQGRIKEKHREKEKKKRREKDKVSKKEADVESRSKQRRKKRDESKQRSCDDDCGLSDSKSLKEKSSYVSTRKEKDNKLKLLKELRKTFSDSDSDLEIPVLPSKQNERHSSSVLPSVPKELGRLSSTKDSVFDELVRQYNESKSSTSKEPIVSLERLEDNEELCAQYNLPSSKTPSPVPPECTSPLSFQHSHPQKKGPRKVELVEALPQPHRKAFNRGISSATALKMYDVEKKLQTNASSHDSNVSKSSNIKDPKTARKEKLAQVAELQASRRKRKEDLRRAAPTKVKNTKSRGEFLTDEKTLSSKPKSRKDLVHSIKIPKLKDKPVTHHPIKSPLQAMNMSWEKDKKEADEVTPASCLQPPPTTESIPVEIPTGPQPKKRHSLLTAPRIHQETSASSDTILPPCPVKSCLSSSSKHNIALNASKLQSKKQVRFKEKLVDICYIEKLPNTRSVASYKDADRPKAISKISSKEMVKKGTLLPNDESVLQDVIYDICKWNPLWLKEEKDLPPDTLPPVVSNMALPTVPRTEFLDFEEYHNTMYPLLMLELWNGVSKSYNLPQNESRNNMFMAVDSATSCTVMSRPERILATLNCHMLIDNRKGFEHPRLGNLVIIDLVLKDSSGNSVVSPIFGYVCFDVKERLRKHDQVHKDLVSYCPNPAFKIRFSIQIRERKGYTFVFEKPLRVKNVKYVRGDLRVFQAMKNLGCMPLRYSIISPSAGNEDFSLPDVSKKMLAMTSLQLNPTQEKIVLQTAEVCQQTKPKICMIQGPPGTGKSHVISNLVIQLLYRDRIYCRPNRERGLVPRILLCAPSNNAVDVLVRRLLSIRQKIDKNNRFKMVRVGQPQTMHPEVFGISLVELARNDVANKIRNSNDPQNIEIERRSLAAKLQGIENTMRDLNVNSKPVPAELTFRQADLLRRLRVLEDRFKQHVETPASSSNDNFGARRDSMKAILRGADIVATTLNSCAINIMETVFPPTRELNHYHFQVCIVDEATQCLEVETLIPLMLQVKTLVLVGDPNQLPATILSKVVRDKGLGTSLFARLQKIFPQAVQMLNIQYRMHPEILRWPNKYFYHRCLKTADHLSKSRDSSVNAYTVFSLPFLQDPRGEANYEEAKFVVQLAELLIEKKAVPQSPFSIGIVCPYQSQRRALSSMLQERLPQPFSNQVEANTIDSYQGQEKDVIILSCVRTSGIGFMSDPQRLNVALTRAKYALFICGNFSSLDRDPMWNNLLMDARVRKCFQDIRNPVPVKEEIWRLLRK